MAIFKSYFSHYQTIYPESLHFCHVAGSVRPFRLATQPPGGDSVETGDSVEHRFSIGASLENKSRNEIMHKRNELRILCKNKWGKYKIIQIVTQMCETCLLEKNISETRLNDDQCSILQHPGWWFQPFQIIFSKLWCVLCSNRIPWIFQYTH